jgi:hypothetical protein
MTLPGHNPSLIFALLLLGTTASLGCAVAARSSAIAEHARADAPCWAYDLHYVTLIEDHGLVGDTAPDVLAEAALSLVDARSACRAGDIARALRLYEAVPLDGIRNTPFYRVLLR